MPEINKVASTVNSTMSIDRLETPVASDDMVLPSVSDSVAESRNDKVESSDATPVLGSSVSVPPEPPIWFTEFSKTLGSTIASAVTSVLTNQQLQAKEIPSVAHREIIKDLTKLVSSFSGSTTDKNNVTFSTWERELTNFFDIYKEENLDNKYKVELAGLTLREVAFDYFKEIESSISSVDQLFKLLGKRFDTRLNQLQVYLELQSLHSVTNFEELAQAITKLENKAPSGFPQCFYTATFLAALPPEIRSFMLADDIKLTSPWRTCLNRARCYVSNSGVSINVLSAKDKGHRKFLPKSVRNSNKGKSSVASMRYFNCNKRVHISTACPFDSRRKKSDTLMAKSSSNSTESKNY